MRGGMRDGKYKVGDKFLVEITAIRKEDMFPYVLDNGNCATEGFLDEMCKSDDMTAEEAWKIAWKIVAAVGDGGYSAEELRKIFGVGHYGRVIHDNTPQQAKAKIEAWEAAQEIEVGDVVYYSGAGRDCAVISIGANGYIHLLDGVGGHCICCDKSCLKKTDRHIDIQSVLRQIGGAN